MHIIGVWYSGIVYQRLHKSNASGKAEKKTRADVPALYIERHCGAPPDKLYLKP